MDQVIRRIDDSIERFTDELMQFCRFESVSADPAFRDRVNACADWLIAHLGAIGFPTVERIPTKGHPLVFGHLPGPEGAPTVLIYGHYDVQPPDPLDLWKTPPFEPTIRDGKLFGRGTTDDKGQVFLNLKALQAYREVRGALPVSVKVLIEGEEEIGSVNFPEVLKANAEKFASDVIVVSDTSMWARGLPSISYALRGLVYFQIDLDNADTDLHSGGYGGAIANPANVLADILASMKDPKTGRILIDGFYDDVAPISEKERESLGALPFDAEEFLKRTGAKAPFGEEGFSTLERLWCRPTVDVNGLWGGYQGEGAKTVLPSKAGAKFSLRIVPNQSPDRVVRLVEEHVKKICPPTVRCKLTLINAGKPFLTPLDNPYLQKAARALAKVYHREAVYLRVGGSIPIVAEFAEILRAPVLLLGFGLPDEKAHAPNEHFHLENFVGGIKALAHFYDEISRF